MLATLSACGKKRQPAPASDVRVASGVVASDEILWRMGSDAQARVVAVSAMADNASYSQVAERWPESVPRLGRDVEQVLALEPSVVILASFSNLEYRAALEPHAKLVVLEDFDGFAGYRTNVGRVAEAAGLSQAGDKLVATFDERLATIEAAAPANRPSCVSWGGGYVAAAGTTFHDSVVAAGCNNAAADAGLSGHKQVDVEQLVLWDPDYVVIDCGSDCAEASSAFESAPGMADLAAVKAGHVIAVPTPVLTSVGEGMLDLAEQIQARISATTP